MAEVHIPHLGDWPEDQAHMKLQLDLTLADDDPTDPIDLLNIGVEAWSAEIFDRAGLRVLSPNVVVEWDDEAIAADVAAVIDEDGTIRLRPEMIEPSDVLRALAWWLEPDVDRVAVRSALYATLLGVAQGRRQQDILLAAFDRCGVPVEAEDLRLADPD
jgi:hypothetical protein